MKVLYVATISNTVNRFLIPHIEILLSQGNHVDIACNVDKEISSCLREKGCRVFNVPFHRSPLCKYNYKAYKAMKRLIKNEKYDLIHTHTPIASACVRIASRKGDNTKVIYTAHGFHFYKGAPVKNWLVYYPIEKLLAKYTDVLITINEEDNERAKKYLKANKVQYIPGVGLNLDKFNIGNFNRIDKKKELGIEDDNSIVILSVGELNKNKNHEAIIRALSKINSKDIYYLICGQGPLKDHLEHIAKESGLGDRVKLLGYREDILEICKLTNIFTFLSYREGLSVALMEAMASGLPIVCSDIRGNRDLIKHGKGGYLVAPNDIYGISQYIQKLMKDDKMRNDMGEYNKKAIKKFSIDSVKEELNRIYFNL